MASHLHASLWLAALGAAGQLDGVACEHVSLGVVFTSAFAATPHGPSVNTFANNIKKPTALEETAAASVAITLTS